jgi:phage host-nuclease inhibitor protein Gam
MSNRIKLNKLQVPIPETREEAEKMVREITTAKLRERSLKADMDSEITAIKKRFESRLADVDEQIQPRMAAINAWATAHQADFGNRKSLDMTHGVIGWRVTPPTLKPINGFTWPAVLNRLRDLNRFEFIRVKEDVNKEAMLGARESENLKKLYVQVVQDDEFYVDPKLTDSKTREVMA